MHGNVSDATITRLTKHLEHRLHKNHYNNFPVKTHNSSCKHHLATKQIKCIGIIFYFYYHYCLPLPLLLLCAACRIMLPTRRPAINCTSQQDKAFYSKRFWNMIIESCILLKLAIHSLVAESRPRLSETEPKFETTCYAFGERICRFAKVNVNKVKMLYYIILILVAIEPTFILSDVQFSSSAMISMTRGIASSAACTLRKASRVRRANTSTTLHAYSRTEYRICTKRNVST